MRSFLLAAILLTSLVTFAPTASAEINLCDTAVQPCDAVAIDISGVRGIANNVLRNANCEWKPNNDITCRSP